MKLSLKLKIYILITLPTLGLLILIAMFISKNYADYEAATKAVDYVKYAKATSALIHELQKERGKSALYLGGKATKEEMQKQREIAVGANKLLIVTVPQTEIKDNIEKLDEESLKALTEARNIVDTNGAAPEATKLFGKAIQQLILSEILAAQTASAFGNEKKLLSVAMLDLAKENAGKLRANITNVLNANKEINALQIGVITGLQAGLNENLSSPTLIITDETKSSLVKFKESSDWIKSMDTIKIVLDLSDKGNFNQNPTEFFDGITNSINSLGQIIFTEQEIVSNLILKTKSEITNKLIIIIGLNSLLLVLVLSLGFYFIRSITGPIQLLMDQLNNSSAEVNNSSEKVSQSSELLSQNSTEQAAALQEAVTSLEEITQMIGRTAENAKVSQAVSATSYETANEGQKNVVALEKAIKEISQSNDQIQQQISVSHTELEAVAKIISEIGQKTRVINDIVFQTKLLSFNASVEAARAGEQGKGFAVVAEEVGNLATMSGNAAKEITEVLEKSLILVDKTIQNTKTQLSSILNQSRDKVEVGSKTAVKCGASLEQIVEKVQEVNQLVIEIATASQEQSQGMSQVSLAMNELDQATHSNSRTSVETAQAGHLLKTQADDLNKAIEALSKVIYG